MNWKSKFFSFIAVFLICFTAYLVLKLGVSKRDHVFYDFGAEIPSQYDLLGIDISHHQGVINWEQLSNMNIQKDSIEFIYIKATEGTSFLDQELSNNIQGANEFSIPAGFYHFFRPKESAIEQASFFIASTEMHDYQLKPVLDVEVTDGITKESLQDSLIVFLNKIEVITGERPLIYTYSNFFIENIIEASWSDKELFWIAQYGDNCPLMQRENVLMWQFSDEGTVSGVNEKVDLNKAKKEFFEQALIKR